MRIFYVGGGTGGHFYPLMAIADKVATASGAPTIEQYYIGPVPYNTTALESRNIRYVYCPAGKLRKYASVFNVLDTFKTLFGLCVAIKKLYFYYPDVIMSKGGFTSVPVVLAAWFLRIPVVIHESDTTPGTANKLAARFARYIAVSYPEAAQFFPSEKVALTGIPIRQSFFTASTDPFTVLGIEATNRPVIFITGGSSGAVRLNNLVLDSLDELLPYVTIIHQVGTDNVDAVAAAVESLITDTTLRQHYIAFGHITAEQMSAAYDVAALVISRSGSTSIHELAIKAKPAILIPIPEAISRDQRTNAYTYATTGAATVLEEENMNDSLLVAETTRIMGDIRLQETMKTAARSFAKTDAADTIAQSLIQIGNEH